MQPLARMGKPGGVSSQASSRSERPSPSVSRCACEQPFSSTSWPASVLGQSSWGSLSPSPSESDVRCSSLHPWASTAVPAGVSAHKSTLFLTPSSSSSSSDCEQPSWLTCSPCGVLGQSVSSSLMTPSPSVSPTSMSRQPTPESLLKGAFRLERLLHRGTGRRLRRWGYHQIHRHHGLVIVSFRRGRHHRVRQF